MKSGIFAVVTLGPYRLYVSEVDQLKHRWAAFMAQFEANTFPHTQLQQAWHRAKDQRQFTFHTAAEISRDEFILGRKQFFLDVEAIPYCAGKR